MFMNEIGRRIRFCGVLCFLLIGAAQGAPLRILPLGDSITYGYWEGNTTNCNSYRKVLKGLLDSGGYETDFVGGLSDGDFGDNQHHGHGGWFADDSSGAKSILGHIPGWMADTRPDIVLLHVGTNDIMARHVDVNEVSLILDEIYAANSRATVVLALIIRSMPGSWQNEVISTFNNNLNVMAQARIAAGEDLLVVDMENGAGIDYASADMADELHPSQIGYDKMGTNWYPSAAIAIKNQRLKKQPVIESISIASDAVTLHVSNLSTGELHIVEQAGGAFPLAWTNVSTIIPSTITTNLIIPAASSDAGFFRIAIP